MQLFRITPASPPELKDEILSALYPLLEDDGLEDFSSDDEMTEQLSRLRAINGFASIEGSVKPRLSSPGDDYVERQLTVITKRILSQTTVGDKWVVTEGGHLKILHGKPYFVQCIPIVQQTEKQNIILKISTKENIKQILSDPQQKLLVEILIAIGKNVYFKLANKDSTADARFHRIASSSALLHLSSNPEEACFSVQHSMSKDETMIWEEFYRDIVPFLKYHRQPFLLAALLGHLTVIQRFLKEQQMSETEVLYREITLNRAAKTGHLHIVKYLVEKCLMNPKTSDKWGRTVLHYAVMSPNLHIVQYLIEKQKMNP